MAKSTSGESPDKSLRDQFHASVAHAASVVQANPTGNVQAASIALADDAVQRLALARLSAAGEQPSVYYIPTSTTVTWVVFAFRSMLLSFRVAVDLATGRVVQIEEHYIPERSS